MKDSIYFISDAHLGSNSPDNERSNEKRLIDFLERIRDDCQALYILGDLFEFWFEYKNAIPKEHITVLMKLKQFTESGISVIYLVGNHDFWLGDFLPEQIGIKIVKNSVSVELQDKKVFLIHGDGLAKKDTGYRILKKILRNKVNIWLYRLLPPDFGIPLAKKIASFSRDKTKARSKEFLRDYEEFAEAKIEQGHDAVIIGHTHQPFYEEVGRGVYINLGDWFEHFTYGKLTQGRFSLLEYSG
ncbi:MAG TPA: UDP-2,3-diacylglucosamine diphosphatase [Terriglobales bacterium]|nr:UDP-2,3-diacylglucosamine diphosphatase [Terriglobales bacterium]